VVNRLANATDLSALSGLAPELATTLASIAGDIALVIDGDGVIRNVAVGTASLTGSTSEWVGRPWADTVTGQTRLKIEQLLQEVSVSGVTRRREVNLPGQSGASDIPVAYAAIRLGEGGPVLAVGRDLRAIAAIQQRFVESQREMERNYWKRRQADARYRQLFQVATDAVLVVDALAMTVVEANGAAAGLFGVPIETLVGRPASLGLDRHSRAAVDELLSTTRTTGRPAEIRARLDGGTTAIDVSAAPFRSDNALLLLVRARAVEAQPASSEAAMRLADFVERTPDAVVITDSSGRVGMGNPAFLSLCQSAAESQTVGRSIGDWLVPVGRDLAALLAEVRQHGIAPRVAAAFTGPSGKAVEVEVSVVLLTEGDQECLGFTIRRAPMRGSGDSSLADDLAMALEDLSSQIGRVDLPALMREASRLAERHLVSTALSHARQDRSAAARALGIEVESLELRMRRLGLLDTNGGGPLPTLLN
jgi:transcriptional regulator PpsR